MLDELRQRLAKEFKTTANKGWLTLSFRESLPIDFGASGKRRLGKLMPNGEIQLSIGATKCGKRVNLNATIERVIRAEGLTVLGRHSTNRSREAKYPAFQTRSLSVEQVLRILHRIEGAALQAAS